MSKSEIIQGPQLNYLLELFVELGKAGRDFVLAGARAIHFYVDKPRFTGDFDFILDVLPLRGMGQPISKVLEDLGYQVVPESRNFQFEKEIPDTGESFRIEFMASEKERRTKDFRVDVQEKIHARSCTGAEIVLKESDFRSIQGFLPNGEKAEIKLRVARPHALLMLKMLAMDDRYRNIRGPEEARHDREEAKNHAADIISIVRSSIQKKDFCKWFWAQFDDDLELECRIRQVISDYYKDLFSPGIQLYEEHLRDKSPFVDVNRSELERALREVRILLHESE